MERLGSIIIKNRAFRFNNKDNKNNRTVHGIIIVSGVVRRFQVLTLTEMLSTFLELYTSYAKYPHPAWFGSESQPQVVILDGQPSSKRDSHLKFET